MFIIHLSLAIIAILIINSSRLVIAMSVSVIKNVIKNMTMTKTTIEIRKSKINSVIVTSTMIVIKIKNNPNLHCLHLWYFD